jgi:hypothetical protein
MGKVKAVAGWRGWRWMGRVGKYIILSQVAARTGIDMQELKVVVKPKKVQSHEVE